MGVTIERIIVCLFILLIFLNPFPHTTFFDQLFFYAVFPLAIILIKKERFEFYYRSSLFYPLCLYFFWSLISVFFALDPSGSFHDLYSHLVRYLLFYLILINFFNNKKKLVLISVCIILSEVIFTLGTIIYQYGILGDLLSSRLGNNFSAIAIDIMPFGFIMGIILAGWLLHTQQNGRHKILLAAAMLILLCGTILTHSRGAILSLFFSIPVLFWNNKKSLLAISIIIVIIGLQTPLKNRIKPSRLFNDNARKALIYYSIEIIKDYPVVGTGFAIDTFRNPKYISKEEYVPRIPEKFQTNKNFFWPHNMLLHMGVRTGIVGMLVYLSLLISSFFTCAKLIFHGKDSFVKESARCSLSLLIMFMVNGLLQPVFIHFLDTIFFIIIAMVTITWKINDKIGNNLPSDPSEGLSCTKNFI